MTEYDFPEPLQTEMLDELNNILSFWSIQAIDKKLGGFVGQIKHSGEINPAANKGVVLNTRLLWTFSAAYRLIASERLEMLAERAFNYLLEHFVDNENGGLFWELDCFGNPVNTRKQAYAQAFGIYAFSEYYMATGNSKSLEMAMNLYQLLEEHFKDRNKGGYVEALSNNWQPLDDMRLSSKDANFPKSMNTHLHVLEAYTNLYRAWPNEELKQNIVHILEIFQNHIIDKNGGFFNLFFEMDWTCKSSIFSFGHNIEGAWLMNEAARITGGNDLISNVQKVAVRLVDHTIEHGVDADGGLFYEMEGGTLDTDKHWWPQAEAMVGLMDAWEITGNKKYLDDLLRVWNFVKENMIDYENGEWYWRVDQNGNAIESEDKAGFWKCPYHNSRALMEVIGRIKKAN